MVVLSRGALSKNTTVLWNTCVRRAAVVETEVEGLGGSLPRGHLLEMQFDFPILRGVAGSRGRKCDERSRVKVV